MTKFAEQQIQIAMGVYQAALDAAHRPVRSVDVVGGLATAGVTARHLDDARRRLHIYSWTGTDGFIWLARYRWVGMRREWIDTFPGSERPSTEETTVVSPVE